MPSATVTAFSFARSSAVCASRDWDDEEVPAGVEVLECELQPLKATTVKRRRMKSFMARVGLTIELTDAGGQRCSDWKSMRPARIRSSDWFGNPHANSWIV